LIRDTFRSMPTAVDIDPNYSDQLWVKDCRFDDISETAVIISNEKSPLTEIGFENAVLKNVPTFARFRESGKTVPAKAQFTRSAFQLWTHRTRRGNDRQHGMIYEAAPLTNLPTPLPPAIRALPPTGDWANVHTLGVAGDGKTNDTVAIQKAIETHRVLYFPSGHYIVSDTTHVEA